MLARKCCYIACLAALVCPMLLHSQQPDNSRESAPDRNSISLHMVGTVGNGSLEGTTRDRRLFLIGAAYNRLLTTKKIVALTFTSQLIPVALLREPYFLNTDIQAVRKFPLSTETRRNYGAGASPGGHQGEFSAGQKGAAVPWRSGRVLIFQPEGIVTQCVSI